jgi:hypothetical protein
VVEPTAAVCGDNDQAPSDGTSRPNHQAPSRGCVRHGGERAVGRCSWIWAGGTRSVIWQGRAPADFGRRVCASGSRFGGRGKWLE